MWNWNCLEVRVPEYRVCLASTLIEGPWPKLLREDSCRTCAEVAFLLLLNHEIPPQPRRFFGTNILSNFLVKLPFRLPRSIFLELLYHAGHERSSFCGCQELTDQETRQRWKARWAQEWLRHATILFRKRRHYSTLDILTAASERR